MLAKGMRTHSVYDYGGYILSYINHLTLNDPYIGRTTPLNSKRCILYIYSTNICTEYFKNGMFCPFFSLQNAVCFIILTFLVPVLFTFYIHVLKFKKIMPVPKGYDCIQAPKYSCTVKDDFILLIKETVFIEHLIVKEFCHGLYNTWKTFSHLYWPSTVNSLCCDAAYDSRRASLCAPHADQHRLVNPPIERNIGYPVGPVTKKVVSCQRNQPFEEFLLSFSLALCYCLCFDH